MIELSVGKKKVELPEKLTIAQYKRLSDIEDYSKKPIQFITAVSGLSDEDVKYANKKEMEFVFRYLVENYLGKQEKQLKTEFEFKGKTYGLMSQMSTLNFGGWVDLEFLTTDGVSKNMEKIVALMYRPIIKRTKNGYELEEYDHDEMEERAELFLELPVDIFWGVANFFFNLVKAYTKSMEASSEYQKTKKKALTRLKMMNPLYHLSKLYRDFIGPVLCRWRKKMLPKSMK